MSDLPDGEARPAPAAPARHRQIRRDAVPIAAAVLAGLTVAWLPLPGIDPWGQRVLAIVTAALVLWISEAVPVAVTAVLVIALLALLGPGPSDDATRAALYGFQLPAGYFLLGTMVIGAATVRSGLASRLAHTLAGYARTGTRVFLRLLAVMPVSAILLPSGLTRNAILVPAYEQVYARMGVARGDRLPKLITLSLATLQLTASTAVLTGGVVPITAAFLLGGFGWLEWFLYMSVPCYALILIGGALYLLWLRPERRREGSARGAAALPSTAPAERPAPWSARELRALAIIGTVTLLWIGDAWTGWNPLIPALLGAVLLMTPGIGVLTWKDFEQTSPWSIFLVTGSSLSIAFALETSGAASWLAGQMLGLVPLADLPLSLILASMLLVVVPVNIILPTQSGVLAILIPLLGTLSLQLGINPIAVGLMITIVIQSATFYPVQNPATLLVYQTRHFAPFDLLRAGLILFLCSLAVIALVAIPWWSLVGLALTA